MKYTKTESILWLAFAGSCLQYLSRLVPYLCVLDTLTIDWMGGVLHRTKTLATGGDCCDFYLCKKGSKWDES
ncbi:MAG: L-2-amino-thiazoline-4-carboxylic acid hydrolase [Lachnospiraceae bacterium]|nr:L-2-amino-thiazoline-4-carboxylic acid hydrolase [Lachnospiraceae bacterium]